MPEDPNGLPHDVKADTMAVAGSAAYASEQIEYSRHLVARHADTSVVDFDKNGVVGGTATDENATSRIPGRIENLSLVVGEGAAAC
jgi:hypothetical protein